MKDFGVLSHKQQVAHLLYYFIVTFNTCGVYAHLLWNCGKTVTFLRLLFYPFQSLS